MNEPETIPPQQEDLEETIFQKGKEIETLPLLENIRLEEGKKEPEQSFSEADPASPRENFSAQFMEFKKEFDKETDIEKKLQLTIDFMEISLAQGGTPHFRSFWEVRRLCLPLFKENISSAFRYQMWNKYSELSKEARRLKDILDEQSNFAVEQIEMAILALEKEILQLDQQIEKSSFLSFDSFPKMLQGKFDSYERMQKHLNILNAQAARINALRKELLKTEMRIRHKNKFFQQLSHAGDQVFPKRKELIKEISQHFSDDIDQFIEKYFGKQPQYESIFVLREEIKALQGLAKLLTLNTNSFTHTRTRLSECWDQIKTEEKERKKERAQQRILFKQNAEDLDQQIRLLKETIDKNEISSVEAQKRIDNIGNQMRKVELGREEVKFLRDSLNDLRKQIQDKAKVDDDAREQAELEHQRRKKQRFTDLKEKLDSLLQDHETYDADRLFSERESILAEIQESTLSKSEKQELERRIKPLRDLITEKKEQALLALSEDDRQTLQQLKSILQHRKERRQEVKDQLETLRKAAGASGLDFEKAMNFTQQMNEEKERLEKAHQSIKEIENKIVEVQAKNRQK